MCFSTVSQCIWSSSCYWFPYLEFPRAPGTWLESIMSVHLQFPSARNVLSACLPPLFRKLVFPTIMWNFGSHLWGLSCVSLQYPFKLLNSEDLNPRPWLTQTWGWGGCFLKLLTWGELRVPMVPGWLVEILLQVFVSLTGSCPLDYLVHSLPIKAIVFGLQ